MKTFSILILLIFAFIYPSRGQNISGVINTFTNVNSLTPTTLSVASSSGFTIGNKILIIQMQGATINETNAASFGDITNYNNAGNYEINVITGVSGNTITLQNPLCLNYSTTSHVQLISIPTYTDATVTGTLTCNAWNGNNGGVLALEVTGTLILNADIDVSGKGFRGGAVTHGGFGCSNPNWYLSSSGQGGQKGESIAPYVVNKDGGRGKWAAGGGGGHPGNSGGGGGGNASAGGLGGFEYSGCGATGIQGIGGLALTYTPGKAFMGSGGGGGFGDNGQPVTPGTNGGGIILIIANNIVGNSFTIRSDGLNQTAIASDESAGGGGAGGCMILNVKTYTGPINIEANGGDGGSNFNNIFSRDCHGTGGGGGTGMLLINQPSLPANVTYKANGGHSGLITNPSSTCYNTTFGGTPGPGIPANSIKFNAPLTASITPVNLGNDTAVCTIKPIKLNAGNGYSSYLWQDGSTDSTYTATTSGRFNVEVTNNVGCKTADTITISLHAPLVINLGMDISVCFIRPVPLDAGSGYTSYVWQDGSTNSTFTANALGDFSVQVMNSDGCTGGDTINISLSPQLTLNLGKDTALCPGGVDTLDAGTGLMNYLWQDGSNSQKFVASQPGKYYVSATNSFGCPASDTIIILPFLTVPPDSLIRDTTVCPGTPIQISAPKGYSYYLWDNRTRGINFFIVKPGIHTLKVINAEGCSNTTSISVTALCPPTIYFPNTFSPNHDGRNDVFKGFGINITSYNIKIYNRWGELVFQTSEIDNGWDGTFNSMDCAVGSYVYVAEYTGNMNNEIRSGIIKGSITIIR